MATAELQLTEKEKLAQQKLREMKESDKFILTRKLSFSQASAEIVAIQRTFDDETIPQYLRRTSS